MGPTSSGVKVKSGAAGGRTRNLRLSEWSAGLVPIRTNTVRRYARVFGHFAPFFDVYFVCAYDSPSVPSEAGARPHRGGYLWPSTDGLVEWVRFELTAAG